jgi:hypothetical protein
VTRRLTGGTAGVLESALAYAARGSLVVPLYNVAPDGVCTCRQHADCPSPGKHPRLDHGVKGASGEEATLRRWFERQWPGRCNIGIATGQISGLVVVDIDPRHHGFDTLARLERDMGPLPTDTPRVRTGGGGLHVSLAYPEADGLMIRNSAGVLGPGLDIRGHGGYVVAPPSVTPAGAYTWLTDCGPNVPPAPIPTTWLTRMAPMHLPRPVTTPSATTAVLLPLGMAALGFIGNGAPVGEQRSRALAATRNLLARGTSVEDTINLIWQGLERSPQEPGRPSWTRADAETIVLDLEQHAPPPLRNWETEFPEAMSRRRLWQRRLVRRTARQVRVG